MRNSFLEELRLKSKKITLYAIAYKLTYYIFFTTSNLNATV